MTAWLVNLIVSDMFYSRHVNIMTLLGDFIPLVIIIIYVFNFFFWFFGYSAGLVLFVICKKNNCPSTYNKTILILLNVLV